MTKPIIVTAIVGTYRQGGTIDTAVDLILAAAHQQGAETVKINLLNKHLEFCTNCRSCAQQPGPIRGICPLNDDMIEIMTQLDRSSAIVLASPMNFGTVTALMKQFIERLTAYAYWPWGQSAPKYRFEQAVKPALLVASSGAPAILARLSSQILSLLKKTARVLGAKPIGVMFIGLAAQQPRQELSRKTRKQAQALGTQLVIRAKALTA